ncbi:MAG: hypothetical protein JW929_00265 [Anaerolineales bacterium]|nr:hypothetical protein [Anaerolineales bacterium]
MSYNPGMDIRRRSRRNHRVIGIVLAAAAALLATYALWPTSYRTESFLIESSLLPQDYLLEVRYPRFGPAGEIVSVNAILRPQGAAADFPPAGEASPVVVAEIQSATLNVAPAGQISTPLQMDKPAHFYWSLLRPAAGSGQFNLFLFKAGAADAQGVYVQQPVWARSFPYSAFPGPQGWKYPLLFFGVLGGVFGLGLLALNLLQGAERPARPILRRKTKIR